MCTGKPTIRCPEGAVTVIRRLQSCFLGIMNSEMLLKSKRDVAVVFIASSGAWTRTFAPLFESKVA